MKTWSYGINCHSRLGSVELVERPWWLALAEWFAFWVDWAWLSEVDLPNWPKIAWEGADEPCSPREWWGTVGGAVNAYVTNPLYQWVWRHPRNRHREVDLGYDKVRELFYADAPEFFDGHEERWKEDESASEAHTAREAIDLLATGAVDFISLDHDLAGEHYTMAHHNGEIPLPAVGEGTGCDVACWIEEAVHAGRITMPGWAVHSANPSGAERLRAAMTSAERFARKGSSA
jgi:hypothetical protein